VTTYGTDCEQFGISTMKTATVSAGGLRRSLSEVVILEHCCHLPGMPLKEPDKFSYFVHPLKIARQRRGESAGTEVLKVRIVLDDGDNALRYIALNHLRESTSNPTIVVRRRACLRCSLNRCHELRSDILIA
jgi:hypothetical protein